MSRSVLFHQRVIRHPGAEAFTDLSGMVQPGTDTTRIVGIIGEADAGTPGIAHLITDSQTAVEVFGAGSDLADACRILFQPSNDDDVDGGAVLIYAYNAKRLTQAERWLVRDPKRKPDGTPHTGQLTYVVSAAAFRVESPSFTAAYLTITTSMTLPVNVFQNMIAEIVSGPGKGQQRQIDTVEEITPGSSYRLNLRADLDWDVLPFSTLQTTTVRVTVPEIKLLAAEWGARGLETEVNHRPADNADNLLGYLVKSKSYGRLANRIAAVGGGIKPTLSIKFDPTDNDGNFATTADWIVAQADLGGPVQGTTDINATATDITLGSGLGSNTQANRWLLVTGGSTPAQQAIIGKMYKITGNDGDSLTLASPGIGFVPGAGLQWKVLAVTDCVLEITGSNGVATTLDIKIKDDVPGSGSFLSLASIDLTQKKTILELTKALDEVSGIYWTLGKGISTSLATSRFDFGEAADHWRMNLIGGPNDSYKVVRDNTQKLIEFIAADIGVFSAERATGPGSSGTGGYEDEIGGAQPESNGDVFYRFYNGKAHDSTLAKPEVTSALGYPVSFENGFEILNKFRDIRTIVPIASDNLQNWDDGDIEALVVMLQDNLLLREANKADAQAFMGLDYPLRAGTYRGRTFDRGVLDIIRDTNDPRMSICAQTSRLITSSNQDEVLPSWATACHAAGIHMGAGLGEAITFKRIKSLELGQPYNDWDPLDIADMNEALDGALLFGEPDDGAWRFVRGYTTYVEDDNLGKTDTNVWAIRNELQRDLRILLERRFTGKGVITNTQGVRAVPKASVASIKEAVATYLENQRSEGIIVDSQDEQGNLIHAWHSLKVNIDGDKAYVRVSVFPKVALNFILIDFTFALPRFSA